MCDFVSFDEDTYHKYVVDRITQFRNAEQVLAFLLPDTYLVLQKAPSASVKKAKTLAKPVMQPESTTLAPPSVPLQRTPSQPFLTVAPQPVLPASSFLPPWDGTRDLLKETPDVFTQVLDPPSTNMSFSLPPMDDYDMDDSDLEPEEECKTSKRKRKQSDNDTPDNSESDAPELPTGTHTMKPEGMPRIVDFKVFYLLVSQE